MDGRHALVAAGAAVAVWLGAARDARAADPSRAVVVHVRNYAKVDARDLDAARRLVDRRFADVGVRLVWNGARWPVATATLPPRARHVTLDLLRGGIGSATGRTTLVLGQAARGAGRAWVFVDRLRHVLKAHAVDATLALARVIAHEIGHLLLPPGAHADVGIMQATLAPAQLAFDGFTPDEGRLMRATLDLGRGACAGFGAHRGPRLHPRVRVRAGRGPLVRCRRRSRVVTTPTPCDRPSA